MPEELITLDSMPILPELIPEIPEAKEDSKDEGLISRVINNKYEVQMQDFIELSKNRIDEFDVKARLKKNGYESTKFPLFTQNIEGLSTGFYIFAGPANSGKTAFMTNLAYSFCTNPKNKLFMVYYTLDDTAQQLIPRLLSMIQRIPIGVCAKPLRYQHMIEEGDEKGADYIKYLELREEGLKKLREQSSNLLIAERRDAPFAEVMVNHAQMVKAFLKTLDPENNIIVCIDSLADIRFDSIKTSSDKEKNDCVSKFVKEMAFDILDCPVFASHHVVKNRKGKASIGDLKESGEYEFDATAVFMINNDVSRDGQRAALYYNAPNKDEKMPILEVHWAKNKASSFKERTYHYFVPEYSLVTECDKDRTREFDAKIYQL